MKRKHKNKNIKQEKLKTLKTHTQKTSMKLCIIALFIITKTRNKKTLEV